MGGALITLGREIESVQEVLAALEQPWGDRHVQLVDEPDFKVLADGRHTAADLHIPLSSAAAVARSSASRIPPVTK